MVEDRKAQVNVIATAFGEPLPYPGLELESLSQEMQARVAKHLTDVLLEGDRRGRVGDEKYLYLAALEHFGIRCPHYRKIQISLNCWECLICSTYIYKLVK